MKLYYGRNDSHEFWEDFEHKVIILRNYESLFWSGHYSYGFVCSEESAKVTAKVLEQEVKYHLVFKKDKEWVKQGCLYRLANKK